MNLRDELLRIRDQNGTLTPHAVVEDARPAASVLHDAFEWDNEVAGPAYRIVQARALIASVRVSYRRPDGAEATVRAFHSITRGDNPNPVYEPTDEIVLDPQARRLLVAQMERDWHTFRRRYEHLEEFAATITQVVP